MEVISQTYIVDYLGCSVSFDGYLREEADEEVYGIYWPL